MKSNPTRPALVLAGAATLLIAAVHLSPIFVGPAAFDYLDAEPLARMMEQGSPLPAVATCALAVMFAAWGLYGLSGAGLLRPLPKLSTALLVIGTIFALRGLGVFWFAWLSLSGSPDAIPREIGFSLVSLVVGLLYLQGWRQLLTAGTSAHPP